MRNFGVGAASVISEMLLLGCHFMGIVYCLGALMVALGVITLQDLSGAAYQTVFAVSSAIVVGLLAAGLAFADRERNARIIRRSIQGALWLLPMVFLFWAVSLGAPKVVLAASIWMAYQLMRGLRAFTSGE
jgi:hypothetical protein